MTTFKMPVVPDNPDGWGPTDATLPLKFKEIPYAPFSKSEKLGRVADWYTDQQPQSQPEQTQSSFGLRKHRVPVANDLYAGPTAFSYVHTQEDEGSFSLVDHRLKSAAGASAAAPRRPAWGAATAPAASSAKKTDKNAPRRKYTESKKESSVAIGVDWKLVNEFQMFAFNKLVSDVAKPVLLAEYGSVLQYDREYDRMTPKNEKKMTQNDKSVPNLSASQDPLITQLGEDKFKDGDLVFATSQVMAALMSATRSQNSWDIVVTKKTVNGRRYVYFDKRDGSSLDFWSVDETSTRPPFDVNGDRDHVNSPSSLAAEATEVNRCLVNQVVLKNKSHPAKEMYPGQDADVSKIFRYKAWDLRKTPSGMASEEDDQDQSPLHLVVRTDVDSCMSPDQYVNLRVFSEYYPMDSNTNNYIPNYVDWRKKLVSQSGAVLITELRNNQWKVARWALEALLAESASLKVGFATRVFPKDPTRGHSLLNVQTFKPDLFASQLNLNMNQCWGILKSWVEIFLAEEDGMFVIYRDPNVPKIKLYRVPEDAFTPKAEEEESSSDAQQ